MTKALALKTNIVHKVGSWVLIMALIVSLIAVCCDIIYGLKQGVPALFYSMPATKDVLSGQWENAENYANVIVTVIVAIIVALLSITITIFVFLKSALDRIIDENRYITDVANIYKMENSGHLFKLCRINFFTIILSIVWHVLFSFKNSHNIYAVGIGIACLILALLYSLVISVLFWRKCIYVEASLQTNICQEYKRLEMELKKHNAIQDSGSLALIGDWNQWKTDGMAEEKLKFFGGKLCASMTIDQFINLFSWAEILLLEGDRKGKIREPHDSDIITVLQERNNTFNPNSEIGNQDMMQRSYLSDNRAGKQVIDFIVEFEKRVGYKRGTRTENEFFKDTEDLYSVLSQYRNLLISWKFTILKPSVHQKDNGKPAKIQSDYPGNIETMKVFAQGLYYFLLRILSIFVSSIHISNFSFNGFTLKFANFYSSTLEHISLYSAEFYHTIFARAQLIQVVMDISRFESIDFYSTKFANSTMNNAKFHYVNFDGTQMDHVGLSSCCFEECSFKDSDFVNCVLNNSEFLSCIFDSVSFAYSKMRDIVWRKSEIEACSFQNTDIRNWKWEEGLPVFRGCDFDNSLWEQLNIFEWDLSGCSFSGATLSGLEFKNTKFHDAIFTKCNLSETKIQDCSMGQCSMEKALLFGAEICNSDLSMVNLFQASAVKLNLSGCNLADSNCADVDFSESVFKNTDFHAARLYDCSLTKAKLYSCKCDYLLADHLQFTFADCKDCSFQFGSFSESNLTKTVFKYCRFNKSDLTGLNATQTIFYNCNLENVDFSGTRFLDVEFNAVFLEFKKIKNCNFSNCIFENVVFENVLFENCIFTDAIFSNCTIKNRRTSYIFTKSDVSDICKFYDNQIFWY